MTNASHTIRQELRGILIFLGVIWAVFIVSRFFPNGLNGLGVTPRTLTGLVGIAASPFLHQNLGHLLSNTIPLLILLVLLAGSQARSWEIVIDVALLGGLLLWICGRSGGGQVSHVGASGLVFGLIAFMIVSGFEERRIAPMIVAMIVCFLYGGTLIWNIVPHGDPTVSWDGHLTGAIAGAAVAYARTPSPEKPASETPAEP
ncbi:MAG: rhomboid family intramembrane serine protease [Thermoguttaceae bacterium]